MAEVKWTPQALDDLEAICLFIARDAPQVAAVFAQSAFRATDRLVDFPRSGRVVPELHDQNFREIILGNYRLIYRIQRHEVQILTVHHGARLIDPGQFQSGA
ncbi:MAG: type II toxin-antitoxin system RelE/ParE family toxin [Acidobacteria bacterium]|nr:type II toxin-antitoxin system RelE/ParE family toxin [Acidobacteriota bacterium]